MTSAASPSCRSAFAISVPSRAPICRRRGSARRSGSRGFAPPCRGSISRCSSGPTRRTTISARGAKLRSPKRCVPLTSTYPSTSRCRIRAGATARGCSEMPGSRARSAGSAPAGESYNRALPMKLLGSPASPYTRKVRVVLAEKRIECEMELVDVQPAENPVNAHNPLGKIPTLLLDDGSALYDSRVIVDFLDARSPISRLIPDETRDRLAVRRWEALADGVLDAGLLVRYESLREPRERSQSWSDKQVARMHRALAAM